MKLVVALTTGFYEGSRVRAGTEFEVPDDFKGSWVAAVDSPAAAPKIIKPRAQPRTLSEMAKAAVTAPTDIV
jgi:hypothetical protein